MQKYTGTDNILLRIAAEKDAAELRNIYAPYVENTAITFEYVVPSVQEFEKRIKNTLSKYPYIVAEYNGELLGYAYAGSFHERAAYNWAVETSIYVKMDKKRMGIGSALYDALEKILKKQGILNLNACIAYTEKEDVHLTNDSVYYHEKLGYSMVGRFHKCGYKFQHWYDMVWMEKSIGEHKENQSPTKLFSEIRDQISDII